MTPIGYLYVVKGTTYIKKSYTDDLEFAQELIATEKFIVEPVYSSATSASEGQSKRLARAERALVRAGFTDHGGEEWRPPIGKPPIFIEVPEPVPDGWQLVPKEPTDNMGWAADAPMKGKKLGSWPAKSIYRIMLAAAPKLAKGE